MSDNMCEQDPESMLELGSSNKANVYSYEELVRLLKMEGSSRFNELIKSEIVILWNRHAPYSSERTYLTNLVLRLENYYFKKTPSDRQRLKVMRDTS